MQLINNYIETSIVSSSSKAHCFNGAVNTDTHKTETDAFLRMLMNSLLIFERQYNKKKTQQMIQNL